MRDFIADHPGEYAPPADAPVGLPAWLDWAHFFNAFLMVLIVRTGLQFRHEARPPAYWARTGNGDGKISLTLWLHQSLDLLWIALGVSFFVLLFTTGQWMRVVPTSRAVFPNAISVALQYASLHWPSENGWVAYNSLQQLAYFVTVFVAAPLAILTGARLSGVWPKGASALNRAYPIALARRLHFPAMLYFVAFIVVHVTLVFVTAPLRNFDHMFAARGSLDATRYMTDWTGAVLFLAAVLFTVAALVAISRPRLIAPVASRFGKVSSR
ncbi:MAG: cytochrome b/b6 domain-containing protein [Actinobacteria bacterium]|nr:cytochrome b/b6 domain-containing protein [Actinomycetota bacterium]